MDHWSQFYSCAERDITSFGSPWFKASAFAVQCTAQYFPKFPAIRVVDLGCGNGRDSIHIARFGHRVLGVDICPEAIGLAQEFLEYSRFNAQIPDNGVRFLPLDVRFTCSELALLREEIVAANSVYARFLLHAINSEVQAELLHTLQEWLRPGCSFVTEVRAAPVGGGHQVTYNGHFRRLLEPKLLYRELEAAGFEPEDFRCETGEKFGDDQPDVIRIKAIRV